METTPMSTNTANVLTGEGWRDSIEALVRGRIRGRGRAHRSVLPRGSPPMSANRHLILDQRHAERSARDFTVLGSSPRLHPSEYQAGGPSYTRAPRAQ